VHGLRTCFQLYKSVNIVGGQRKRCVVQASEGRNLGILRGMDQIYNGELNVTH
jgi:hypothetical protein